MAHLYLIEDDPTLRDELGQILSLEGFTWDFCDDFAHAAEKALQAQADCIILDAMIPHTDGRIIARSIRAASNVPIIMLTCLDSEFDECMALNAGADDYLVKPFRPAVLLARIHATLRRSRPEARPLLEYAGVSLDIASGKVCFNKNSLELSRNEAQILSLLLRNPGTIISRQELMCDLWESDAFVDDNTLSVNVNRLRKNLASIGVPDDFLQTKRGLGYTL